MSEWPLTDGAVCQAGGLSGGCDILWRTQRAVHEDVVVVVLVVTSLTGEALAASSLFARFTENCTKRQQFTSFLQEEHMQDQTKQHINKTL